MLRTLLVLTALVAGCASAPPKAGDMVGEVVVARLDHVPGINVGCGGLAFYGPANYTVVDGPRYLKGKKLDVLVWCLDDVKRSSPNFTTGQSYRLHLTKQMPYRSDVDQPLEASPNAFYLRGEPELLPQ